MNQSESWYVMLPDGDVHRVTLDQLDEAFQAGHVDAETLVLADGAQRWTRLGQLAGLDDAAQEPAFEPGAMASAWQPRPPASARPADAPSVAPYGYEPAAPRTPVTYSFRPVSVDLSEVDLDDVSFRGNSGRFAKRFAAAVIGLAALGGIAVVARSNPHLMRPAIVRAEALLARAGLHLSNAEPPVQAVAPPAPVEPASPPVNAPVAMPPVNPSPALAVAASPATAQTAAEPAKPEAKAKAHAKSHARPAVHTAPHPKSTGFTTHGDKYDPLNSTITP